MVSALDSGSSGLGSSTGRGHCVVFLGKTLSSHSASLHPSVQMGTGKFNANFDSGESCASEPGGRRGRVSLHATATGKSSGLMGQCARIQT